MSDSPSPSKWIVASRHRDRDVLVDRLLELADSWDLQGYAMYESCARQLRELISQELFQPTGE